MALGRRRCGAASCRAARLSCLWGSRPARVARWSGSSECAAVGFVTLKAACAFGEFNTKGRLSTLDAAAAFPAIFPS